MVNWSRSTVLLAGALALTPVVGCGGGGDGGGDGDKAAQGDRKAREKAVDGTFVGKLAGTDALVAVVASPPVGKKPERDVTVYLSDGERLSEWFAQSVSSNEFAAASDDRDARAKAKLSGKAVSGTIKLPDGKTARFRAQRATGPAGLYELKVTSEGKLKGASSAGVGLTGAATLSEDGEGTLKLADGKRRKFDVHGDVAAEGVRLKAGQVRLIVLRGGELRGVGKQRPAGSSDGSHFFITSS